MNNIFQYILYRFFLIIKEKRKVDLDNDMETFVDQTVIKKLFGIPIIRVKWDYEREIINNTKKKKIGLGN